MKETIAIASDHAGYQMKLGIIKYLEELGYSSKDYGSSSLRSVNYPDFGHPLALAVEEGDYRLGISLCGSGNGINMVTNKHQGIRGALCWNREIARLARSHNDANCLTLGGRILPLDEALHIVKIWLETEFEGGRHQARLDKIKALEKKNFQHNS